MRKQIPINFYTKIGQDTTFHILGKIVEQNHFFPFFKTQNRCLIKFSVLSRKYIPWSSL